MALSGRLWPEIPAFSLDMKKMKKFEKKACVIGSPMV
jgi:hypothetical protein